MTKMQVVLPDVGEGLTEAEIVSWKVAVGDEIHLNQVVVEIETAKSIVELPSPYAGVARALLVEEGKIIPVGTPILTIDADVSDPLAGSPTHAGPSDDVPENPEVDTSGSVLVGYGSAGTTSSRRRGRSRVTRLPAAETGGPVRSKPPVRKLAKDLGVLLARVSPTGPHGDITREDVLRFSAENFPSSPVLTGAQAALDDERIPVRGVRKATAAAMVRSAFSAPHVSLFVDVDATRSMELIARLKTLPSFDSIKVSPLLIVAKALTRAARRNPLVNSTWTDEEIILHRSLNLGIAVSTPRGLVVPNIKGAHTLSLRELAEALNTLSTRAREGKTTPAEMTGGTITITNIGVFGIDTGTPLLNPRESAILALGTIKQKPWVVDGEVRARFVTTLGASFDHRVVDGDVASRFLADIAAVLEEPGLLLDDDVPLGSGES